MPLNFSMVLPSYEQINIFNDKTYTMKKLGIYSMLLAIGSVTFVGCSSAKKSQGGILGDTSIGSTAVKTVATIVGLILLSKLLKSVLNTVGGSSVLGTTAQQNGLLASLNENTKLSAIANNDLMRTALQVLVAEQYKIPLMTVTKNFNGLTTAGDLATFIGKNADAKVLLQIK
jgi:hypothetical protein